MADNRNDAAVDGLLSQGEAERRRAQKEMDRRIQAEREPEIIQAQQIQAHEASRGELLRRQGLVRQGLASLSPLVGPLVAQVWIQQQQPLRQGITTVALAV
jgi:hypothetical protein